MIPPAIKVIQAAKSFGRTNALNGVTFEVHNGELFGFLGPNGAGKTTTLHLLMGFIKPTSGSAKIFGLDTWKQSVTLKTRIGFLPDTVSVPAGLTAKEFLEYVSRLRGYKGRPPLQAELLDRLELSESSLARQAKTFSQGMKKKLGLIQAMQHDPELIVMDEPTEALDPLMRQAFFSIIREFHNRGKTIVMSSHVLPDVDEVCERVVIIRNGRVIETSSVQSLRAGRKKSLTVIFRKPPPVDFSLPGAHLMSRTGNVWEFAVKGEVNHVIRALSRCDVEDITYERLTLDQLFRDLYERRSEESL